MRGKMAADDALAAGQEQTAYDREQDTINQGEDALAGRQKQEIIDAAAARDKIAGRGADYTGESNLVEGERWSEKYDENGNKIWVKDETGEGGAFSPDAPQATAQGPYASQVEMESYVSAKAVLRDQDATPKARADAENRIEWFRSKWNINWEEGRLRQSARTGVDKMLTNDIMDTILPGLRERYPMASEMEIRELLIKQSLDGKPIEGLPEEVQEEIDKVVRQGGGAGGGRQGAFDTR